MNPVERGNKLRELDESIRSLVWKKVQSDITEEGISALKQEFDLVVENPEYDLTPVEIGSLGRVFDEALESALQSTGSNRSLIAFARSLPAPKSP